MDMEKETMGSDLIDVYEQMLFERASRGIRPVLYISSNKDLECSVVMLLDEPAEELLAAWPTSFNARIGSQPMTS